MILPFGQFLSLYHYSPKSTTNIAGIVTIVSIHIVYSKPPPLLSTFALFIDDAKAHKGVVLCKPQMFLDSPFSVKPSKEGIYYCYEVRKGVDKGSHQLSIF